MNSPSRDLATALGQGGSAANLIAVLAQAGRHDGRELGVVFNEQEAHDGRDDLASGSVDAFPVRSTEWR